MDFWENKNVLITGHTGFKGSWLSLWLHLKGARVSGLSLPLSEENKFFKSLFIEDSKGMKVIEKNYYGDINNFDFIRESIEESKPDIIFHLAAQPLVNLSFINPLDTWKVNTIGTINLLESIRLNLENCIAVFITSDKVYDNQEWSWGYRENDRLGGADPYSASKACAELSISSYFRTYFRSKSDIKICSVRAGNVIGGGDWALNRIIPDCVRSWLQNKPVCLRNPNSTRPWQHVLEPVSGYLTLASKLYLDKNLNGENFNFGPNETSNKTVKDLIDKLSKRWGFKEESDSYSIRHTDDFHEAGLLQLDCSKANNILNWKPNLSFDQMINLSADWYKEFYNTNDIEGMVLASENQIKNYIKIAKEKNYSWTK